MSNQNMWERSIESAFSQVDSALLSLVYLMIVWPFYSMVLWFRYNLVFPAHVLFKTLLWMAHRSSLKDPAPSRLIAHLLGLTRQLKSREDYWLTGKNIREITLTDLIGWAILIYGVYPVVVRYVDAVTYTQQVQFLLLVPFVRMIVLTEIKQAILDAWATYRDGDNPSEWTIAAYHVLEANSAVPEFPELPEPKDGNKGSASVAKHRTAAAIKADRDEKSKKRDKDKQSRQPNNKGKGKGKGESQRNKDDAKDSTNDPKKDKKSRLRDENRVSSGGDATTRLDDLNALANQLQNEISPGFFDDLMGGGNEDAVFDIFGNFGASDSISGGDIIDADFSEMLDDTSEKYKRYLDRVKSNFSATDEIKLQLTVGEFNESKGRPFFDWRSSIEESIDDISAVADQFVARVAGIKEGDLPNKLYKVQLFDPSTATERSHVYGKHVKFPDMEEEAEVLAILDQINAVWSEMLAVRN